MGRVKKVAYSRVFIIIISSSSTLKERTVALSGARTRRRLRSKYSPKPSNVNLPWHIVCDCLRQLSAIGNHNLLRRRSALAPNGFDRLHDLHAFRHASKHAVLPVQPRRLRRAQEKLRPVRVRPRIGHGQNPWSRVLERKVFVLELVPVDGLSARSVLVRKITSLAHEARNDAMKRRRFVPESGFPGAQLTEVFSRFRAHVRSEL